MVCKTDGVEDIIDEQIEDVGSFQHLNNIVANCSWAGKKILSHGSKRYPQYFTASNQCGLPQDLAGLTGCTSTPL